MSEVKTREIDAVTGVETTGHTWDGIKELNKPLPRWWIWSFYACIVWAVGYWIVYPAWPTLTGYTPGIWHYSQRQTVAAEIAKARGAQAIFRTRIDETPLVDIRKNPDLFKFATAAGASAFQTNCAPCHGRNGQGFLGYPNLADDEWMWGGSIEDIHKTIQFGVRSEHKETRNSQMPRFGVDKMLDARQIDAVAELVLSLSGRATNPAVVPAGRQIYDKECVSCHKADGKGDPVQGAPSLVDKVWLYGDAKEAIIESIHTGRGGQMPWWIGRLDTVTLKSLAVYVHSLGSDR